MLYQSKNPHGGDLYGQHVTLDYSANTNPLGTPKSVQQAVINAASCLHQYPDPYCRGLVRAIADFENVPQDYVLCGCGAAELIFSYCTALRPRRALELAPTFSEYSSALEAVGCVVERYALSPETEFILSEKFLDTLREGTWDVLFLCNPNNPTGQLIPRDLLLAILDVCHRKGIRLFLDECFLDLTDCDAECSMKRLLGKYSELFILKAFTKSYGMAGIRLGYCLCGDRKLLADMGRAVQPWNVSLPAQMAGVAALQEIEFLQQTKQIIQTERAWLCEQLKQLGIAVCQSRANYLLFYSREELGSKLMERGIQIRDCSNYHGLGNGWYRIAVRLRADNIQLISAVRDALEEL